MTWEKWFALAPLPVIVAFGWKVLVIDWRRIRARSIALAEAEREEFEARERELAERYAQTVARPRTPEEVADVRERARKLLPGGEG